MAVRFSQDWQQVLSDGEFVEMLKEKIETEMNEAEQGNRNSLGTRFVSVRVRQLSLGSLPPVIIINDLPEFSEQLVRAVLRIEYSGDAEIVIEVRLRTGTPGAPILPVTVSLSAMVLRGLLVVDVREVLPGTRDICARFLRSPLQSFHVATSLDGELPFLGGIVKEHIGHLLRAFFMEELPDIVKHRFDVSSWLGSSLPSELAPKVASTRPLEQFGQLARGQPFDNNEHAATQSTMSAMSRLSFVTRISLMSWKDRTKSDDK